jgi:hypothetical protein
VIAAASGMNGDSVAAGTAPVVRWVCALVVLAVVWLGAVSLAHAQAHAIGPGHEARVLALFAPYALGGEVADGHRLWGVAIDRTRVQITLRARDGSDATLALQHPDDTIRSDARSESFAIVYGSEPGSPAQEARRALVAAIVRNDAGGFWEATAGTTTEATSPLADGLVQIGFLALLSLLLAARLLAGESRGLAAGLVATVIAGALVRLALSPQTFLGAWPWSRLYPHARAVAEGPWLTAIAEHTGHTVYLTDVMLWTSFAYAVLMPLALFAHATYLLRDARAGLAAAFAVAFLPQHIRFSISEDGFVGSLLLTSLAFAMIHGFLRDRARPVRWLLLLALPAVLYPGYLLRPLNILFLVVYAAAIVALHGYTAPRLRRGLVLAVVLAVGAAALVRFFAQHERTVTQLTPLEWLGSVFHVLVVPRLLVLTDPTRTPPALLALAVVGAVLAWRAGERRLVAYLLGWLLLFVVAHAVVVQESMQARYHMHLVVPFLLLGALAVPRLAVRHRPWLVVAALSIAAAPWLHRGFLGDVDYTEQHEYAFVRRARDLVPEGCTVLEYTGGRRDADELRFSRIGQLARTDGARRFRVVGIFPDGRTGEHQPTLDALLANPPPCLYLYEGLACSAWRALGEDYAAGCLALRERLRATPVRAATARVRLYDRASEGDRPLRVTRVPFRLSRAHLTHD